MGNQSSVPEMVQTSAPNMVQTSVPEMVQTSVSGMVQTSVSGMVQLPGIPEMVINREFVQPQQKPDQVEIII